MRIETKYLSIELEPELVTEEHLARVQRLITLASHYEKSRRNAEKPRLKGGATETEPVRKRKNRGEQ